MDHTITKPNGEKLFKTIGVLRQQIEKRFTVQQCEYIYNDFHLTIEDYPCQLLVDMATINLVRQFLPKEYIHTKSLEINNNLLYLVVSRNK